MIERELDEKVETDYDPVIAVSHENRLKMHQQTVPT
jgi:hypothetical protein